MSFSYRKCNSKTVTSSVAPCRLIVISYLFLFLVHLQAFGAYDYIVYEYPGNLTFFRVDGMNNGSTYLDGTGLMQLYSYYNNNSINFSDLYTVGFKKNSTNLVRICVTRSIFKVINGSKQSLCNGLPFPNRLIFNLLALYPKRKCKMSQSVNERPRQTILYCWEKGP